MELKNEMTYEELCEKYLDYPPEREVNKQMPIGELDITDIKNNKQQEENELKGENEDG